MTSRTWTATLDRLTILPRGEQFAALTELRARLRRIDTEAWNTTFGPDSLYNAWTQLPFVDAIYGHNREAISAVLHGRSDWHVVEIGGGNGALWHGLLDSLPSGTFTLIDPNPDAHQAVRQRLPGNVDFHSVVAPVASAAAPPADVVVCSLTLHHHAGENAAQREAFGMTGDGKLEILRRVVAALRSRSGIGILNEADCYNDIALSPGDETLVDHFLDVYVRRAARAVAHAIDSAPTDSALTEAWEAILRHWCIEQVDYAFRSREERDVYELDVVSWVRLLGEAGAADITHRYTDPWNLFVQYLFR
ncbi:class I SAM-dependent methyltransferase [Mycolicibacterium smegmatis]|uniref:class I SAM-dependent methyltransferase n=1 Tax=Mycolicibacterium smegmatis TaxID=1772 RepID=UPI0005D92D8F|nr:class I SAM-dependent methyltransferase [Mycolicibacterium smegmatis]MCP2623533.1 class I SAM-dependent methyltransferase [Mycolicibacterium smegmatis]MDF1903042.1 class I SAM-dependent methyltransferase [Mycolicibacterium smegmatis]MDF1909381.1 class I SAM-dependent methyltransferase [Mycolicibacterium smegmatis]MDF1921497.1 class I SAM-dependent methyltransferase [Mycolicibacterium smegmatis]MDF1927815.1 class I SAM-dependent methyltransferase [Mycolicibacterium smegmatis]